MPWPASRSASRARGTVRAARDHARRNASSPALSGITAGPCLVMGPQYLLDEASASMSLLDAAIIYTMRERAVTRIGIILGCGVPIACIATDLRRCAGVG